MFNNKKNKKFKQELEYQIRDLDNRVKELESYNQKQKIDNRVKELNKKYKLNLDIKTETKYTAFGYYNDIKIYNKEDYVCKVYNNLYDTIMNENFEDKIKIYLYDKEINKNENKIK